MTITVIGRDDWGGGPLRRGNLVDTARFVGLVVHHTVMVMRDYDGDGFLRGDLDDVKRYMKALQVARPDLGSEIPYSWVVFHGEHDDDVIVAEGRGFGVTGAHTTGYNSTRYGVAYAGNASEEPITDGVLEGYRWVGRHLDAPAGAEPTIGHRDTKSTECPGDNLYAQLGEIQPPFATEEEDDMTDAEHKVLYDLNHTVAKVVVPGIEKATAAGVAAKREVDELRAELRAAGVLPETQG